MLKSKGDGKTSAMQSAQDKVIFEICLALNWIEWWKSYLFSSDVDSLYSDNIQNYFFLNRKQYLFLFFYGRHLNIIF